MKYYFLILAFNEEKYLAKTFIELKEVISQTQIDDFQIIINNDGSSDRTGIIAKKIKEENDNNVEIITYKKNVGISKSIKNFIKKHDKGKLVIISGDNDLEKEFIKKMIIASYKTDFVISYFINREKKGWFRAHLSTLFNLIMCAIFNVYAFYLQGPCIWPIDKIKKLHIHSNGIAYASEVNIKLLRSGLNYIEVEGIMNVGSEGSTSIKLHNFIDIAKTVLFLLVEIKIFKRFNQHSTRVN